MGGERSSTLLRRPAVFIRPLLIYLLIVLILAVAFSIACGDGGAPDAEPAEPPPPGDTDAIRGVDFQSVPEVQTLLRQLGSARVDADSIIYGDLTGDQREEAAVPIDSGGSLGNVAFLVFSHRAGVPAVILTRTLDSSSGIVMRVEGGKLIETRGEFGPEDPFCCPSKLRQTSFRWDGTVLQVEREEMITNPAGGAKQ
jgi:hypothetical protein